MRKYLPYNLLSAVLILCMFICLLPLSASADTDDSSFVIAVATDLHIEPGNTDPGPLYALTPQNGAIIDAMLWDAVQKDVDVLLLLGDVTNAAHFSQHNALIEKLNDARANGLTIYVLPGNHDIGDVRFDDFPQLYADFGYNDCFSRDPASLSYSVYNNGHLFIMIDTGGYYGYTAEASICEDTVSWIQKQIDIAVEKNWTIIPCGHYPILSTYTPPFPGQLELIEMLKSCNAPLYLCGHRHQRHVSVQGGLTELVVDRSTEFPCTYGIICETLDSISYSPRSIPVSRWAAVKRIDDPVLMNFEEFLSTLFRERSIKVVDTLLKDRKMSPELLKAAQDFIYELNKGYADGTLSANVQELREHPGYEPFLALAEGTVYYTWVPASLDSASPFTEGFIIRDGKTDVIEK